MCVLKMHLSPGFPWSFVRYSLSNVLTSACLSALNILNLGFVIQEAVIHASKAVVVSELM